MKIIIQLVWRDFLASMLCFVVQFSDSQGCQERYICTVCLLWRVDELDIILIILILDSVQLYQQIVFSHIWNVYICVTILSNLVTYDWNNLVKSYYLLLKQCCQSWLPTTETILLNLITYYLNHLAKSCYLGYYWNNLVKYCYLGYYWKNLVKPCYLGYYWKKIVQILLPTVETILSNLVT